MSRIANRLKQLEAAKPDLQETVIIFKRSFVAPNGDITGTRLSAIFMGVKLPEMRGWCCETEDKFEARVNDIGQKIEAASALTASEYQSEIEVLASEITRANETGCEVIATF